MNIRDDLKDHQLVVGCVRDSMIHVGSAAFQMFASGLHDKVVTLAEAKFMAACDVSPSWGQLAQQQVIFGMDENGMPCFVKGGLAVPKAEPVADVASIEGEVIPAGETVQ